MMHFVTSILLVFSLPIWLSDASSTYCVSENRSCNTSLTDSCVECQPLMWFVNRTWNISNDSTIIFLPGEHSLNSSENNEVRINFSNKNNLTLKGIGGTENTSTVVCSGGQSGFLFLYSSNITITSLGFQGCGASMTNELYGCVFFDHSYDITLTKVSITAGKGFGLYVGDCCSGYIVMTDSYFSENKNGNVVIWLKQCVGEELLPTHMIVSNSIIRNGFTRSEHATGLHATIFRGGVTILLTYVNITNNTGQRGGNIGIVLGDFGQQTSKIQINNCHIEKGHANNSGGGGLSLKYDKSFGPIDHLQKLNCTQNIEVLTIINTQFIGNRGDRSGGGVWITYYETSGIDCTFRTVEFTDCIFTENRANRGVALQASTHRVPLHRGHSAPQFSVTLTNCVISNNYLTNKTDQHNEDGILEMFSMYSLIIKNSTFSDNNGTALMMVNSGVQFQNKTVFQRNSAQYGGALKLCDSSVMYVNNHTRVEFTNNSADLAGGAIYAGNQCLQETPLCFFQVSFKNSSNPQPIDSLASGILHFEGNKAGIAGHAIYGGSVDNCFTDTQLRVSKQDELTFYNSFRLFKQIFSFSNDSVVSYITSDPYGVCLCDNVTNQIIDNCTNRTIHIQRFAGQNMKLFVSPVGQMNGTVPSQLLISSYGNNFTVRRINQDTENISSIPLCQEVIVAVYPEQNVTYATFKIGVYQANAVSESSNYYRLPKLIVNVEIEDCPFPFKPNDNHSCDCPKKLKEDFSLLCDVNSETITRQSSTEWIGYLHNETVFAASKRCKESHCKQGGPPLSIHNLSEVCVEGREGRVCGKCKSSYTLSLGPLNCIPTKENCSIWKFILLVFAFFLAGVSLVYFLAVFNLTVTEGTINGLLFYANCIHANHKSIFCSTHESMKSGIGVFISWLNLDFGFPVCFYSGMTAYQKFWLEFGFLFYLFLLGALIICLSRRSIWFTRLTGRNMVSVLSTIILLAYPKLVRNSIKVWHCHKDKYWASDNNKPWIWHSDETVDCFTGKHIPLFVVSLLLFIAAFLYTLCLLFIQCLQRGSDWCVLRWVNKLRPFFDANTGPCRDHYQFWPGFLLLARLGLYITFWFISDSRQRSYVLLGLCVFIFFLACVSPNGVYKKWPLNLLEFSFFLNLGIITSGVAEKHSFNYAFGYTSMAIAAFTFLLILIYHIYKKLRETRRWKRMARKIRDRYQQSEEFTTENSSLIRHSQRLLSHNRFISPREPLLEDN